jgi:hypothetical protein
VAGARKEVSMISVVKATSHEIELAVRELARPAGRVTSARVKVTDVPGGVVRIVVERVENDPQVEVIVP